jgi:hypothetical protein
MRIINLVCDKLGVDASRYEPSPRAERIFRNYDRAMAKGWLDALTATERCISDLAGRNGHKDTNAFDRQPKL